MAEEDVRIPSGSSSAAGAAPAAEPDLGAGDRPSNTSCALQKLPEVERKVVFDGRENELCEQHRGNDAKRRTPARRAAAARSVVAETPSRRELPPVDPSDVHLSAPWQARSTPQKV
jgi:hypothetical protein